MSPTRPTGPRRARRLAGVGLAAALALALGGCTQIPQSSDVRSAEPLDGATAAPEAPQFRPPGPSADDTAEDVIRGFLLAGTSPQDDYAVAREFLDGPAAARWTPGQRTLVYSAQPRITRGEGTGNYQVQVEVDSEIDEFGLRTIAPEGTTRAWQVSVQERPEGMRITATENGTLLSQSQFGQLFAPHELAFYDTAQRYAVPDVRWFVNRGTTVTAVTRALLRGPAPYLTGAVETAFPLRTGADLAGPTVPLDEDGVAHVDLTEAAAEGADADRRHRMREQLEITLLGLQSVSDVRVTVDGAELSASGENPPPPVQDEPTTGSVQVGIDSATGDLAYFQGMSVGPVGGAPDVSALDPVDPTMSRDRSRFAFVTRDRTAVHVAGTDGSLREAMRGTGLTSPSIDGLGWVWAADGAETSRVRAVPAEPGQEARIVTATWLRPAERIVDLRVSRSGARAALLVDDGDRRTVRVAGIVRGSDGVPSALTEPILLPSTGRAASVEWAGDTNLLVSPRAATPDERVVPRIVSIDGTVRELNPLGGLTGVSAGDGGALYAETDELVFLLVGSSWRAQELERGVRDLSFPG
ncbi:LpqB family beta-propeller domain-containing protein [Micrococcus endophyticus]